MKKCCKFLLLVLVGGLLHPVSAEPFQPQNVPGQTFRLIPESERSLHRLIVGLAPNSTKAYMVPGVTATSPINQERVRLVRRQLYQIHFELVHGNLMHVLPAHTRLFIAVPDREFVAESLGNEAELFAIYLKDRAGWTDEQIKERVSFFKVPEPLIFPQDMAEILGRDKRERLVLGVGDDGPPVYKQAANELVKCFPDDFQVHNLPTLNTEGGDTELVWRPDGSIGLMIGQNRIRRYLASQKNLDLQGRLIPPDWISKALLAFRKGFFGVPVVVLGMQELKNPEYVSTEVFHIDMVVSILRSGKRVMAFVPSYEENPVDAYTDLPLSAAIVKRAQRFYDEVATDLKTEGYQIVRLPIRDHPIRNPVNVGKFTSPATGKATIFLSKYPYHYPAKAGKASVQAGLQKIIYAMEDGIELWKGNPSDANWDTLQKTLTAVWEEFKTVKESANPIFESQAKIYRAQGIDVIPVVIYPSSEGGIHCMLLK